MLRCALHYRSGLIRTGPLPLPATKRHGSIQPWSATLKKNWPNSRTNVRLELEDSLSKREAELKELRSKKKSLLERQIRRAQVRINAKERKRRTRRLILLGSYLDDIIQNDPVSMKRVRKGLDEFLERERDRELFDLPLRS